MKLLALALLVAIALSFATSACSSTQVAAFESKAHAVVVRAQAAVNMVATNPGAVAAILDEADALGINTSVARGALAKGDVTALQGELARLEASLAPAQNQ